VLRTLKDPGQFDDVKHSLFIGFNSWNNFHSCHIESPPTYWIPTYIRCKIKPKVSIDHIQTNTQPISWFVVQVMSFVSWHPPYSWETHSCSISKSQLLLPTCFNLSFSGFRFIRAIFFQSQTCRWAGTERQVYTFFKATSWYEAEFIHRRLANS